MMKLVHLHWEGNVTITSAAARKWIRIAARLGDQSAQLNLGYIFEEGCQDLAVEANFNKALSWYK